MAAVTSTTTTTATPAPGNVRYNKDSMKSTWRTWDPSRYRLAHRLMKDADVFHNDLDRPVPVHPKTDKVPYLPQRDMHRWIITHGAWPLILHQALVSATGWDIGHVGSFVFYYGCQRLFMTQLMRMLREMGHTYGHLDGDVHARDGVPDSGVGKTLTSMLLAGVGRALLFNVLAWDGAAAPADARWAWMPLIVGAYGIVLDFWFYWYHRLMHEVGALWKYHRTHHLTKHPNPLLTLYADGVQEVGDIVVMPLLTYYTMRLAGVRLDFYEWHVCNVYLNFAEATGHSGLRLLGYVPNPLTPVLKLFGAELSVEDHDLHHRRGWKGSFNYGKQTRLWDRVFGTCTDRIECRDENVDWNYKASIPWF
ncbi:Fatty acid hydroxylase [Cordyceps javanica]|uniref:Fatty acid hydroxylase n=1 Tax=Cordyceps javanica TaxID=43265 RepID=A0A545UVX7_9HYPO|nr:Fatty acid hydroxylase [Cordyceps javanica]TQW02361.1 Fatty acid hydroxylase [Cordyceps javanica]